MEKTSIRRPDTGPAVSPPVFRIKSRKNIAQIAATAKENAKSRKNTKTIDNDSHKNDYLNVNIEYSIDEISRQFAIQLASANVPVALRPTIIQQAQIVFRRQSSESGSANNLDSGFVDPTTDLKFPLAPPSIAFAQRSAIYGKKISEFEFITSEWPEHHAKSRIFIESILHCDPTLYRSLRYRAKIANQDLYDFCWSQYGVLSQRIADSDEVRFNHQLALLKILNLRHMSSSYLRSANHLLADLQAK